MLALRDDLSPREVEEAVSGTTVNKRPLEVGLAVMTSLENLMSFPFIREAVADETLTLHGLWTEIGEGGLEWFDPATQSFHPV